MATPSIPLGTELLIGKIPFGIGLENALGEHQERGTMRACEASAYLDKRSQCSYDLSHPAGMR
jgi:hypothetical protein